ncbi:MAG: ABC transporter ATP-binding protein/permease [Spiroplasma sp.]|nr:ABC transporter ATP-binding protein/permease [Spiroplasma sp.]
MSKVLTNKSDKNSQNLNVDINESQKATKKILKKRKPIDKTKPLVELKHITKKYKNKIALDNVSFVINPGDRIGIIGANGSGKSTVSEIIGGIRQPTAGQVIRQENLVIGLQFQDSKYPIGISVMDMIKYYLHTFSIKMTESQLKQLLKTYQLNGLENKFIEGLSGGQQQRLNILLSVVHDPDLVILDEVSTGLDIEVRAQIFEFLQENIVQKNKAMILVTHMMSEVEDFCEKYIYIHNGVIKEAGLVTDLIKKYGSVHAYTWEMFEKNKRVDLEKQYRAEEEKQKKAEAKKPAKKNKVDRLISDSKDYGKNLPLISLMLKYYYKGFFVPFFLLAYPILILFLQGFAFSSMPVGEDGILPLHSLVGSISMVQAMSVGIFIIPQTILEFKNSVLMKRIGATNIKPVFFVISVIIIGFIFIVVAFLWTLLWAGIFFGNKFGWDVVALPSDILPTIPFLVILIITSIAIGMMFASMFKSTTSFIAVSNVFYLPVAFLSGGFIPIEMITNSDILKYITYINPFKYCLDPFLKAWNGKFVFETIYYAYIPISLAIIGVCIGFAGWKLRWQA